MKKASHPALRLLRRSRVPVILFAIAGGAPVRAHGDLHLQIQQVTEEIAVLPSAGLFLKRGTLHHEHGEYTQALVDFDRAEKLEPASPAIAFARARTLFQTGQF